MAETTADTRLITDALGEIARIAAVMFDGEWCNQIVTERSWKWMRDFDPADKWSSHDNYDVEHEPFVAAKKMLLRLQKLAPEGLAVSCTLWREVPTLPGQVACLVQNGGAARWQRFGLLHMDATAEQRQALETGGPVDVPPEDSGVLTVLVGVRDSLKEIAGFVEVSAVAGGEADIAW